MNLWKGSRCGRRIWCLIVVDQCCPSCSAALLPAQVNCRHTPVTCGLFVTLHALVDQRHIHTNVNRKRQTWTEPESVDAVVIIIIMIKTSEIDVTEKLTFDLFSLTWRMRLSAAQWLPETESFMSTRWVKKKPAVHHGSPRQPLSGRAPLRVNDLLSFVSL